ncbi:DUF4254 domain-containing protein [Desulfovibrio sp. OttesenSCG-928-M16]|nr:DUF4254 domain-containing protein [Desulfovibrio sp. OttesenSCG-928-M16]
MNEASLALKAALESVFASQIFSTSLWHESETVMPVCSDEYTLENLGNLILRDHYYNFQLWHVEDEARRLDVDDTVIANCKREVDRYNQKRNDAIEDIDKCLVSLLEPHLNTSATSRQNTETIGMAIDRLSILALKIYHMNEQTQRKDVDEKHIVTCSEKLGILQRQRRDLIRAVLDLITDYFLGNKVPALFAQFKMYNDPNLNPALYGRRL